MFFNKVVIVHVSNTIAGSFWLLEDSLRASAMARGLSCSKFLMCSIYIYISIFINLLMFS